ncbi:MAG: hypothetical protein V4629_10500 [Pseudomonadota bacterium]
MNDRIHWCLATPSRTWITALILTLVPGFGWLAYGWIALITLRFGATQGFITGCIVCVPSALMQAAGIDALIAIVIGLWISALVLGERIAMPYAITALSLVIGSWAASSLFFDQGSMAKLWVPEVTRAIESTGAFQNLENIDVKLMSNITGIRQISVVIILMAITALIFARWWQARLFNPGGFQTEFLTQDGSSIWAIALMGISFLVMQLSVEHPWIIPLGIALQLPLMVIGLSVVHFWLRQKPQRIPLLVLTYVMIVLGLHWPFTLLGAAQCIIKLKRERITPD